MVIFHHEQIGSSSLVALLGLEEILVWTGGAKFGDLLEFSEYRLGVLTLEEVKVLCDRIERALSRLPAVNTVGEVSATVMDEGSQILGSELRFGHRWRC